MTTADQAISPSLESRRGPAAMLSGAGVLARRLAAALSRPASLPAKARAAARTCKLERVIGRSGLFDQTWYRSAYPDLAAVDDPIRHYMAHGAREGRRPNPLFDSRWYLDRYADVAAGGQNPLAHFIISGAHEGRDPNPYFSTAWYRATYPEVAASGVNPLLNYIASGADAGRRPSLRFDTRWYRQQNASALAEGENPLAHFLIRGLPQGRPATLEDAEDTAGEPVERAQIVTLKPLNVPPGRPVALFVTYSPNGRLHPHVLHHIQALEQEGVRTVLIVAAEAGVRLEPGLLDRLGGLYVRENTGFDFGAWAHLLKMVPELYDADPLVLVNDSVVGPADAHSFHAMFRRIRASAADLVGLTDSHERGWHVQSYFLVLTPRALTSVAVQSFFNEVRNCAAKQDVIDRYEVRFAAKAIEAGLSVQTIFRSNSTDNATVFDWKGLLAEGFPYVKVNVLKGVFPDADLTGWRSVLASRGFDLALADAALAPQGGGPSPPGRSAAGADGEDALRSVDDAARPVRLGFYGPWNYASGLGAASRGYLSALWRLDAEVNLHPIKKPFHIHGRTAPPVDMINFTGPADVAVAHLNPDGWTLFQGEQRAEFERARVTIGLWVWEMDRIPESWRANFGEVDAIWTPSAYCAEVFSAATDRPVHVIPHVVAVAPPRPPAAAAALSALGVPEHGRVVLYAFDGASYIVRKNPYALIRAFAASGLEARGWTLVLKIKNLFDAPAEAQRLLEAVGAASAVVLIAQALSREEMSALLSRAAIYASPHCSEGFGLTIAEAMAMGKAVVATDFGGSRDFLDASCGFPTPAHIRVLERNHGHYTRGGRWAQVDEAALARNLALAAAALERGDESMGRRARERIAERLSPEAVAQAMQRSLEALAALAPADRRPATGRRA